MIESGAYKKVILVGSEMMSSITDYTDRNTCPLFGDGAGAVLIEPTTEELELWTVLWATMVQESINLHMKAGGSLKPLSHETIDNRNILFTRKVRQFLKLLFQKCRIFR